MGRMREKVKVFESKDFSGGVLESGSIFANMSNPLAKDYFLKSCAEADNVKMSENGLEKFKGYAKRLSSQISGNPTVTGVYEYKKRGSSNERYFLVTAGTKVYKDEAGTLSDLGATITTDAFTQFVTFNNVVVIMNGVDSPLYFDGTTCATETMTDPDSIWNNATPSFATVFRNRLFYSGDPAKPYRIWTPRPGTHNNFDNSLSTVDAFDVSVGDGEQVTAIVPLSKDFMAVYKFGSIFRLSGSAPFGSSTDAFVLQEVSREIGCVAPRTAIKVGKDHYFLSKNGFKKLSTVFEYGDVRDADPSYAAKDSFSEINYDEDYIKNAFAVYVSKERHIYLHVPTGSNTQNNQVYVHDVVTGAIMPRSGITASCGVIYDRQYYTGSYDGWTYKQIFGDNYDGSAIPSHWYSLWLPVGGIRNKKKFKHFMAYFETAGSATISVQNEVMKTDGSSRIATSSSESSGTDVFDVGKWDTAKFDQGGTNLHRNNNLGRGIAARIKIVNNNTDEFWKINKMEFGVSRIGVVR